MSGAICGHLPGYVQNENFPKIPAIMTTAFNNARITAFVRFTVNT